MPVSVATARDPFRGEVAPQPAPSPDSLRIPQARVLQALMPAYPEDSPSEWPLFNVNVIATRVGVSLRSDSVRRAFYGLREGGRDPHLGLIPKGMAEIILIDIDGVSEMNFRITKAGIRALTTYLTQHGELPPVRLRSWCVNDRYKH